jgi:hypothetical protein
MRLDGVHVDSDSVTAVFEGMDRASAMIQAHDHSAAQNSALPPSVGLLEDLKSLKAFVAKQTSKNRGAEKENAHLKK